MIKIGEANNIYANYAEPGHWNDPDMLEVGNGGMTEIEYRTHFTMWAIMAAPLIAGNDLRNMDQATKNILTAPEVIAVDQDPRGIQGTLLTTLSQVEGLEIWTKPLSGANTMAVMLLNRTEAAATIQFEWTGIGLPEGPALVRDLWDRADRGVFNKGFIATVPSHGVVSIEGRLWRHPDSIKNRSRRFPFSAWSTILRFSPIILASYTGTCINCPLNISFCPIISPVPLRIF